MSIQLVQVPIEIEKVEIATKLTGYLVKDSKNHNSSEKIVALNNDIREYVKKTMTETQTKNNIPSSFTPRDPYAGQINILRISIMGGSSSGLVKLLFDEAVKKDKRKPKLLKIQSSIQE